MHHTELVLSILLSNRNYHHSMIGPDLDSELACDPACEFHSKWPVSLPSDLMVAQRTQT